MKRTLVATMVICFSLMLAVLLGGCAGPSPTDVTKTTLEAFKTNDTEQIQAHYSGDPAKVLTTSVGMLDGEEDSDVELTEDQQAVFDEFYGLMKDYDYKVSNEQIDGDTATVDVEFTTYNLGSVLSSALSDYMSQALTMAFADMGNTDVDTSKYTAAFVNALDSKMDNATEKDKTTTVQLTLTKNEEGEWMLDEFTPEVLDAMTGGVTSAVEEFNNQWPSSESTH